ncbi:LOW QUALITY PROTEIN: putative inactive carboxylesterase 4 [Pomacea canaliculata]|uniref:LOW QUALITY PROTEIN: putative inactive carboxylesterase 4 n=1 Tax=Pomacea canaliculata TaxID=400727 RepID=UPI000D73407A|nr:LOW QUALITY PROTEIN: putative inactive carboxylesterase 4 [Pomacea canaliculata]
MAASSTWTVLIVALMQLFGDVISAPVIRAPWGTIRGVEVQGRDDRKMSGYLGIPFALPPTGKLRWQKPQPHPGPGEGKVFGPPPCYRPVLRKSHGWGCTTGTSEDCLTLNVFVPIGDDVTSGTLKPVMVWIHGGGFRVGDAASYRPTKLVADNDVIVVTIQYRLGVFGFLSTGDATAPGNYGLWDQRLALVWVKDNIRAFGGDPDLVTIFGESAGAISIGIHVISPASNGLFQRVITQSGSPYMQRCFPENYSNKIKELASALGCSSDPGTSFTTMLDCLRGKSVEELTHAETILSQTHNTDFVFMPRVDGELLLDNPGRLMADEVHMALANVGKVDILNGLMIRRGQ